MLRIASALYDQQLTENNNIILPFIHFLQEALVSSLWTHNDEIDSSKLGEF